MHRLILGLIGIAFFLSISGCNTLKGMGQGMKEDYQSLKKVDEKFQEDYW